MKKIIIERNLPGVVLYKKIKKIILATLLLVALSTASFAGEENPTRSLLKEITTAMKSSCLVIHWSTPTEGVSIGTFNFRGKNVSVGYLGENELIGFTVPVAQNELPSNIADAISRKYGDWKIADALMFIDASARTNYFVQVKKGNTNLAIKVDLDGRIRTFSNM